MMGQDQWLALRQCLGQTGLLELFQYEPVAPGILLAEPYLQI